MPKVRLENTRLAFSDSLWEAKTVNGEGTPAHSASLLLAPGDAQVKLVEQAIEQAAREKWGVKADAILKQLRAQDKTCLHDGELKSQYDGFSGHVYVSARSSTRPLIIDRDRSPLVAADGRPYAGCFVNASVEIWAQDNNFGKRINASLKGVQFLRDGDAFAGGAPASADEFDDLSSGTTADDLV